MNQLEAQFLAPENVYYVAKQVQQKLREKGVSDAEVSASRDLQLEMKEIWNANNNLPITSFSLAHLNETVIAEQAKFLSIAYNQRQRYIKWILNDDRMKVMPYAKQREEKLPPASADNHFLGSEVYKNKRKELLNYVYGL